MIMKMTDVRKGLIVTLRGMQSNVRIESDVANWNSLGPGARPIQYDQSRGVLVRYVDPEGKPHTQGLKGKFVVALHSLKLILEGTPPKIPTIADLVQQNEKLQVRIEALENRTLVDVKCESCDGSGELNHGYGHTDECSKCDGRGSVFKLSPLEED